MLLACLKKDEWESDGDQVLWTSLLNGSQEALEELFKRHNLHLFNYGINIVSDRELIRDAIQKVFLTIWRRHTQLSTAHSVKAYLLTALRRSIFEMLERRENRSKRNKKYLNNREETDFPIEDKLIQQEISKEQTQKLKQALKELTPRQKEAIYLKFYNGLTNNEISSVMDINYQCVSNLLYKAISKLRSSMDYQSIST